MQVASSIFHRVVASRPIQRLVDLPVLSTRVAARRERLARADEARARTEREETIRRQAAVLARPELDRFLAARERPEHRTAAERYWSEWTVNSQMFDTAEQSERYLEWRFEQYPLFRELSGLWGDRQGETVLDYGSGPGNDVVGFALYSGATRVIGADVSELALRLAAHRLDLHRLDADLVQLHLISEGTPRLDLDDQSVDFVNSQGVIHHTSDPAAVLRELARVLRPGGRGSVMVYNSDSVWRHLYVAYEWIVRDGRYPGHELDDVFTRSTDGEDCPIARNWSGREFTAMCASAGLEATYKGGYPALIELEVLDRSLDSALNDSRLGDTSRQFLEGLTRDEHGIPVHAGHYAGIGGVYDITKPA